MPLGENVDAISFEVQLGGGELVTERKMTVENGHLSTFFTDLLPFGLYVVTAKTIDKGTGTSSPVTPAIECRTLSSKPLPLQYISSRVGMAGNIPTIVITWERAADVNGNFSNYTFVWGNQTAGIRSLSCQNLYDAAELNILVVTDYGLTSDTVADPRATAEIAQAEMIQLCGRVSNLEFTSKWLEEVTNTTVAPLASTQSSSTALIAVIVLAVVSIIAAIVIAIILAIAICNYRNKKLIPTEEMQANHHHPPTNIKRTMSTKPIIHDEDHDHSSENSS